MRRYSFTLLVGLLPFIALAQEADFAMPSEATDLETAGEEQNTPEAAPQVEPMVSEMPTRDDGRIQSSFTVKLRVMNRKLENTTDLSIPANQTKRYDTLSITPLTCTRDAQGIRDNDMVFMRIEDEGREVFSGWMSQQFPGVSLLQHPHYSVVVLGCN